MAWENYKKNVNEALDQFSFDEEIIEIIRNSSTNNQKIFVGGNGGSAGLADHYTCDLSKGAVKDWKNNHKRYQAICLSTNTGYLTAIANDTSYEEIFTQQLINLANEKDILILISSSGNSPNIVHAANYGKEIGMVVIGITGFSGGKLKEAADYSAHVDTTNYEIAEDVHGIFGHFLASHLREN